MIHVSPAFLPRFLAQALVGLVLVALVAAGVARSGPQAQAATADDFAEGYVVTLNCIDDLAATYSFAFRRHGSVIQDRELRNAGSDITFHRYVPNSLVSGIEGGVQSVLLDLGDVRTDGTHTSVLPFLARDGERIVYRGAEASSALPQGGVSLDGVATKQAAAKVALGHVYLLRIEDDGESRYVAMRVVEYHPGQTVTLRWRPL